MSISLDVRGVPCSMSTTYRLVFGAMILWGMGVVGTGCSGSGSTNLELRGVSSERVLSPSLAHRVYRYADSNTADFFLTDLPEELWTPDADFRNVSAILVHVHTFIEPRPGRTPIADGASNVTVRYLVVSRGTLGLYGGGGFLWRSGEPGDANAGGELRGASMKLVRSTPGFQDVLGPCELHGTFSARKDVEKAAKLEAIFQSLQLALPGVTGK